MKKPLFTPVEKNPKFVGYSLIVNDNTKEMENGEIEPNYYLKVVAIYSRKFIFWKYVDYDERIAFIHKPRFRQEFNTGIMDYFDMNKYLHSIGMTRGKVPAGYYFVPSDHV